MGLSYWDFIYNPRSDSWEVVSNQAFSTKELATLKSKIEEIRLSAHYKQIDANYERLEKLKSEKEKIYEKLSKAEEFYNKYKNDDIPKMKNTVIGRKIIIKKQNKTIRSLQQNPDDIEKIKKYDELQLIDTSIMHGLRNENIQLKATRELLINNSADHEAIRYERDNLKQELTTLKSRMEDRINEVTKSIENKECDILEGVNLGVVIKTELQKLLEQKS